MIKIDVLNDEYIVVLNSKNINFFIKYFVIMNKLENINLHQKYIDSLYT